MSAEAKKEVQLEIAHVLFIDIVGYSKLSINEQHAAVDDLTQTVRGTEQFQKAEAADRLIKIATGDGVALVFYTSPEAPVRCAIELSRAFKDHPRLRVRMGIHSGPVSGVIDVTGRTNLTGAGLNIAQRVMCCGDAGHILLSKHVAEDLQEYEEWQPRLHDLGTCDVKHGMHVSAVNLYDDQFGNAKVPQKFQCVQKRRMRKRWVAVAAVLLALAAIVVGSAMFSRSRSPSSLPAPEKSVAVLPFENLSRDPDNAFFADGVQDEILTDLAKIADLKVISQTSVMPYKSGIARNVREIGQQLGVAHIVEGSVQRAGNRVRVNAQLVDTRTDRHLWGQTYDRDLADVFAIQSEIAKTIADQLQARLSPAEKAAIERPPTNDLVAFDLYTRAKPIPHSHAFGAQVKQRLLEAADLLNQAIARDPNFLSAYCVLAYVHSQLYFLNFDRTPARLGLAREAVDAALRLQPDAGEAHLAKTEYLYRCFLDYEGARSEIGIARRTLPNDPTLFETLAYIDRRQGRWQSSAENFERSIALDPRNYLTLQQVALSYFSLRQYAKMAAALDRALAIVPSDVDTRVARAGVDLDWRADTRRMHATIDDVLARNPADAAEIADQWIFLALCERDFTAAQRAFAALGELRFGDASVTFSRDFGEGLAARMQGDVAAAHSAFEAARRKPEETLRAQPDYGPNLCVLALIDAGLDRKDQALREGQRAIDLLPVEKDAIGGAQMLEFYAITCAWVGEKDLAFQYLTRATQLPGFLSYGRLKLHPFWDPLRNDPRFETIVNSLALK